MVEAIAAYVLPGFFLGSEHPRGCGALELALETVVK